MCQLIQITTTQSYRFNKARKNMEKNTWQTPWKNTNNSI